MHKFMAVQLKKIRRLIKCLLFWSNWVICFAWQYERTQEVSRCFSSFSYCTVYLIWFDMIWYDLVSNKDEYHVSQKWHRKLSHNFANCQPIFKILSLTDSAANYLVNNVLNMSLHYCEILIVTVILGGLTVESHVLCSCCCDCLCPHLITVTCGESTRTHSTRNGVKEKLEIWYF